MPFNVAQLISEITEMLGKMNAGDEELMENHLKILTKWNAKDTKEEKWLRVADLPGVGARKPDWIKGVHKKVAGDYAKAFDAQGNPK